MASGRHDFDWLLDHARSVAFDPGRLSLYVFAMDTEAEDLRQQVLVPMDKAGLFSLPDAKFIADDRREQYRGQLARVALTIFDVSGQQYGIAMAYHEQLPAGSGPLRIVVPLLARTVLASSQGIVKPDRQGSLANALYYLKDMCYIDHAAP